MNILVTGGLGAVGATLVRELRRRSHEVWVCDLSHWNESNYMRCNVADYRQLERVLGVTRFDYVYHLAAEFGRRNGEDYYETLWNTNAVGTKNLIRLQERLGFRMVFFSSSEVYGDYDGVMSEDVMDRIAIRQMNDYAMTKWVSEMQILNSASQFGTETVRVRLFNTYGPGECYSSYRSAICVFIYQGLMNLPYNVYLGHSRTSSYIDDTVRTLAAIVENFRPGEVYNIAGTENHDMKYASDLILKYLGLSDDKVTYLESEPFTTKNKKVDVTKAVRDLGHQPLVSLEEGIPLTIDWMRNYYGVSSRPRTGISL